MGDAEADRAGVGGGVNEDARGGEGQGSGAQRVGGPGADGRGHACRPGAVRVDPDGVHELGHHAEGAGGRRVGGLAGGDRPRLGDVAVLVEVKHVLAGAHEDDLGQRLVGDSGRHRPRHQRHRRFSSLGGVEDGGPRPVEVEFPPRLGGDDGDPARGGVELGVLRLDGDRGGGPVEDGGDLALPPFGGDPDRRGCVAEQPSPDALEDVALLGAVHGPAHGGGHVDPQPQVPGRRLAVEVLGPHPDGPVEGVLDDPAHGDLGRRVAEATDGHAAHDGSRQHLAGRLVVVADRPGGGARDQGEGDDDGDDEHRVAAREAHRRSPRWEEPADLRVTTVAW